MSGLPEKNRGRTAEKYAQVIWQLKLRDGAIEQLRGMKIASKLAIEATVSFYVIVT